MKPTNNNFSPLPFYPSLDLQHHRLPYVYGEVFPLMCDRRRLLPFQIMFEEEDGASLKMELFTPGKDGGTDITAAMEDAGLSVTKAYGSDVAVFPASISLRGVDIPQGRHWLRAAYGGQTAYSEMFTAAPLMDGYTKIEWWDDADAEFDAGAVLYPAGYRNFLWVDTDIAKPEYQFDEEGEERDGYFFPEKRVSEKTYKCVFPAAEFMCDALRLARLSDHVRITDRHGRDYDCDTVLFTVDWEDFGDVAAVTCEFETDTVVKRLYSPAAAVKGDFNGDFSSDFLKTAK